MKKTSRPRKYRESQIRSTQRSPYQSTLQLRCQKLKIKKELKTAREKLLVTHKGTPIRPSANFLA